MQRLSRVTCLLASAAALVLIAAGCGGGDRDAIKAWVDDVYPDGKLLDCAKTDVYAGETVWSCGIRQHSIDTGNGLDDEANAIVDAERPPLEACFIVRNGTASTVSC